MSDYWQVVAGILASVCSAGAIIGFVVKLAANHLADRLAQKYQHQLDLKTEEIKADLENRNHSYQAKFDKEFEIYGKLVPALLELNEEVQWLYPDGFDRLPQEEDEKLKVYQERYENAIKALKKAQHALGAYSIFMPEGIANKIQKLIEVCQLQCYFYTWAGPMRKDGKEIFEIQSKCTERTGEIRQKHADVVKMLREYIRAQLN